MLPNNFLSPDQFHSPSCVSFSGDHNRRIENLSDFFEIIEPYLGPSADWYFRGEKEVYGAPSLPGFARDYVQVPDGPAPSKNINELELVVPLAKDADGNPVLLSCLTTQELEIIREFQKHAPNDEYYERLVGKNPDHPGWLGYAQHYGEKTRLVDVSTDPLVGLYFACDPKSEKDGRVWMYPNVINLHGNQPPETVENAFDPAITDRQAIAFNDVNRLHEYKPNVQRELLIDSLSLFDFEAPNKRVIAQRGKFLWSGNPLRSLSANSIGVNIPMESKETLRNKLSAIGINDTTLFPD